MRTLAVALLLAFSVQSGWTSERDECQAHLSEEKIRQELDWAYDAFLRNKLRFSKAVLTALGGIYRRSAFKACKKKENCTLGDVHAIAVKKIRRNQKIFGGSLITAILGAYFFGYPLIETVPVLSKVSLPLTFLAGYFVYDALGGLGHPIKAILDQVSHSQVSVETGLKLLAPPNPRLHAYLELYHQQLARFRWTGLWARDNVVNAQYHLLWRVARAYELLQRGDRAVAAKVLAEAVVVMHKEFYEVDAEDEAIVRALRASGMFDLGIDLSQIIDETVAVIPEIERGLHTTTQEELEYYRRVLNTWFT